MYIISIMITYYYLLIIIIIHDVWV